MNRSSPTYGSCLAAVLMATACGGHGDSSSVTGPSPRNLFPFVQPITRLVAGSVLDGDDATPIPGAALGLFPPSASPSMTDGNGHYSLSIASNNVSQGFFAQITKPGYEDALEFAPVGAGDRYDFRLYRPIVIQAGAAISVSISEDNALCDFVNGEFEDQFRCRAVHIQILSDGVLTAATSALDSTDSYFLHVGTAHDLQYPFQGVTRVEQAVTAGTIVTLQIMRPWSPAPSGHVRLTTAVVPERENPGNSPETFSRFTPHDVRREFGSR